MTEGHANSENDSPREVSSEALKEALVRECLEVRGEDVVVLDVRELVDYMDFLVIATARSERQNRAIADRVIRTLKKDRVVPLSRAGIEGGHWICLDFVDVVLHLFTPETRAHYDIELLWADAKRTVATPA